MDSRIDFVSRIYASAYEISEKTGMSAELIIAQAVQETGWGEKILTGTNNIFNIKADSSWTGKKKEFTVSEYVNGKVVLVTSSFRVYDSYEEAITDRVAFLKSNSRYSKLFSGEVLGDFLQESITLHHMERKS
jgi:flagellum-specific peptidoglycan hydrolase FlgJ